MENKLKILIVEDEAILAAGLKLTLEDLGYEVIDRCYDFQRAAGIIPHTTADLVMLDINLGSGEPGEDGFALAALLNAQNPKPFIFLTAYNDAETIRRAAALLPSNYLIKPVNPAALFAAIQVTLARTIEPRMQEQTEPGDRPDYFYIKVGSKTHRLSWDDIYCIESGKNYVKLFARDNAAEYPVRGTITFVLDRLVPPRLQQQFFRISRSICLNKAHVTTFSDNFIFCGGRSFPNTRFSVEELYELFEKR